MKSTYQKHLSDLDELAGLIQNNSEMSDEDLTKCDVDTLKHLIQQNKVSLKSNSKHSISTEIYSTYFHLFSQDTEGHLLKEARLKLEDITFDIQCFISEHTQFLSPAESSYLLKFLSTTQRAFRNETERLVTQRSTLDVLLDTRERETQEQVCLWIYYKISQMFDKTAVYTCVVCLVKIRVDDEGLLYMYSACRAGCINHVTG